MSEWMQNAPPPVTPKRRRPSGCGIIVGLIIALATFGGIGVAILSVFAPQVLMPLVTGLSGLPTKQTQSITGDPSHFDPIKSYAEARNFAAKDAQLVGFTARFVRPDGTMDLTATYRPAPQTEYTFVQPTAAPTNAPPIGVNSNADAQWYLPITITAYQPGQNQYIRESSGGSSLEYTFTNNGYSREVSSVNNNAKNILPAPTCDLAQLWKIAIQTANAPPTAVATITYKATGYQFDITGTAVHLTFGMDCQPGSAN